MNSRWNFTCGLGSIIGGSIAMSVEIFKFFFIFKSSKSKRKDLLLPAMSNVQLSITWRKQKAEKKPITFTFSWQSQPFIKLTTHASAIKGCGFSISHACDRVKRNGGLAVWSGSEDLNLKARRIHVSMPGVKNFHHQNKKSRILYPLFPLKLSRYFRKCFFYFKKFLQILIIMSPK